MDVETIKGARWRADHYLASHFGEEIILDPVAGFSLVDIDILVRATAPIAPLIDGHRFYDQQLPLI